MTCYDHGYTMKPTPTGHQVASCKFIYGGVPKMGVPPNHPFIDGFFHEIKPSSYWSTSIYGIPLDQWIGFCWEKLKPESPMIFMIFMGISSHGFRLRVFPTKTNLVGGFKHLFIFRNIWDNPFPLTNIFQVKTTNQQSIEWRKPAEISSNGVPPDSTRKVSLRLDPRDPRDPRKAVRKPGGKTEDQSHVRNQFSVCHWIWKHIKWYKAD